MIFCTMECAFGQFWLAFLAPSWLLVHLLTSRACESGKSLIQTSTSYQQPKCLFVISVILILNSNHTVLKRKLILSQVKPGYLSRPSFSKLLSPCLIEFCNVEKYLTQPFNWSGSTDVISFDCLVLEPRKIHRICSLWDVSHRHQMFLGCSSKKTLTYVFNCRETWWYVLVYF